MTRRTHRRREIERLLALRASEGLSLRELAEHSGIPVGTLSWWAHKLRKGGSGHGFTEIGVIDLVTPADIDSETTSTAPDLVVRHPGGVVVEARGRLAERIVDTVLARFEQWC